MILVVIFLHQCDNKKITLLQLIISSAFQMKVSSLMPNCASAILCLVLCQLSNLYSTFVELTNRFCCIQGQNQFERATTWWKVSFSGEPVKAKC